VFKDFEERLKVSKTMIKESNNVFKVSKRMFKEVRKR
jgi:hypothetical protein